MTTLTATEQVNNAIAESGGNVRDALNATLAQRDVASVLLKTEQERSAMLLDALEAIRELLWPGSPTDTVTSEAIDTIAREVLRASGQIPSHVGAE